MSLPTKQEKFARLIAEGNSQADAYRGAYNAKNMTDKTIWEAASRLMADSKVSARVEAIKAESLQHVKYGIEEHFKELDLGAKLALTPTGEHGRIDINAYTKAVELKGKLKGLYTSKVEHTGSMKQIIVASQADKEILEDDYSKLGIQKE
jgi:phage terminase small subunit